MKNDVKIVCDLDENYAVALAYTSSNKMEDTGVVYATADECLRESGGETPIAGFTVLDKKIGDCAEGVPVWYESAANAISCYVENLINKNVELGDSLADWLALSESDILHLDDRYAIAKAYTTIGQRGKLGCIYSSKEKCNPESGEIVQGWIILNKSACKCAEGVPLLYNNQNEAFDSYCRSLLTFDDSLVVGKLDANSSVAVAYRKAAYHKFPETAIPARHACLRRIPVSPDRLGFVIINNATKRPCCDIVFDSYKQAADYWFGQPAK